MRYLMSTVAFGALVAGTTIANAADVVMVPPPVIVAPPPAVGPTITTTIDTIGGIDADVPFLDFGVEVDVATASGLGFTLLGFGALDFGAPPEREFGFLATVYKPVGPFTLSIYGGMSWLTVSGDRTAIVGGTVEWAGPGEMLSALVDVSRLWSTVDPTSTTIYTEVAVALGPNTTVTPSAEFVIAGGTTTTLGIALEQVFGNFTVTPSYTAELGGGPQTVSLAVDLALGPVTVSAGVDRVLGTSWTYWAGLSIEFGN